MNIAMLFDVMNASMVGLIVALIISAVTGFALSVTPWFEWYRAKFESRLNISINRFVGGVLRIRGIEEDDVKRIVLSPHARKLVKKAAKRTTLGYEFLSFDNERDAWLVYNEIVIGISKIYGAEMLFADIHNLEDEAKYLIAMTWERDAGVQIQKLRVIMVQPITLERMFKGSGGVETEVENQRSRAHTLAKMYLQYLDHTWPSYQTVMLPK
jgi:hypothetical protein